MFTFKLRSKKSLGVNASTFVLSLILGLSVCTDALSQVNKEGLIDDFLQLTKGGNRKTQKALQRIEAAWEPGFAMMLVEVMTLARDRIVLVHLVETLEKQTGKKFGFHIQRWRKWIWNQPENSYAYYARFKSKLYRSLDKKFEKYFAENPARSIRLDEVVWGGVKQDGIPPLRNPKMIHADKADYLGDDNVVFAIEINGDARAYPKRILAWHEMFVDEVGGQSIAGVYCTLCGSMVLYKTVVNGENHEMGTSGFLFRSNKLMYDKKTQSLWNTLWGKPVVGPLVGKNIEFERLSVITTTWKEWKRRHPETRVLSLDTGHRRDYGEGVAYKDYFATDDLMFAVPKRDRRLKNKSEVLGLVFADSPDLPLAISADYLAEHPVYQGRLGKTHFVVFTDATGANRVYDSQSIRFRSWDQDQTAIDENGDMWRLSESRLLTADGRELYRLPAHRAFWFGWFSAYSHTALVH